MAKKFYDVEFKPNLNQVKKRLTAAKRRMTRMEVAHKKIAIFLDRWNKKNFRSEGGLVGGWTPLKLGGRWVKKDGTRFFDTTAKILRDTGELEKSFLPFHSRRNAGIGSDKPYSKKHEEGEGLPKRRMLPLQKDVRRDVTKIFNQHVKSAFKR